TINKLRGEAARGYASVQRLSKTTRLTLHYVTSDRILTVYREHSLVNVQRSPPPGSCSAPTFLPSSPWNEGGLEPGNYYC
ncbi:MAG: hypothetical protein O4807_18020, partial [Trichodesmium sp. St19_bin2]|nr:hypothetical protein [Trichodesmium sp. St19_bin2]